MPTIINVEDESGETGSTFLFVEEDIGDRKTLDKLNHAVKRYKTRNKDWSYEEIVVLIEKRLVENGYKPLPVQYITISV